VSFSCTASTRGSWTRLLYQLRVRQVQAGAGGQRLGACPKRHHRGLDAVFFGRQHTHPEGAHLRWQRHLAKHPLHPHVQRQDGARDRDAPVMGIVLRGEMSKLEINFKPNKGIQPLDY